MYVSSILYTQITINWKKGIIIIMSIFLIPRQYMCPKSPENAPAQVLTQLRHWQHYEFELKLHIYSKIILLQNKYICNTHQY